MIANSAGPLAALGAGLPGASADDIVAGAVLVRTAPETHMAAKAADPRASCAGSAVKCSWKIHTLSAMLTIGLTMNRCRSWSCPAWRPAPT